jgi:hypothetical protein
MVQGNGEIPGGVEQGSVEVEADDLEAVLGHRWAIGSGRWNPQ